MLTVNRLDYASLTLPTSANLWVCACPPRIAEYVVTSFFFFNVLCFSSRYKWPDGGNGWREVGLCWLKGGSPLSVHQQLPACQNLPGIQSSAKHEIHQNCKSKYRSYPKPIFQIQGRWYQTTNDEPSLLKDEKQSETEGGGNRIITQICSSPRLARALGSFFGHSRRLFSG